MKKLVKPVEIRALHGGGLLIRLNGNRIKVSNFTFIGEWLADMDQDTLYISNYMSNDDYRRYEKSFKYFIRNMFLKIASFRLRLSKGRT